MIYCKKCAGKLYEEEIWVDNDNIKQQQVGCYQCSNKIQVEYKEWVDFKNKLYKAVKKANQNAKSKVNR